MCQFRNWYSDEGGYVIQCDDCKHFQVSFGTTMLTLSEQQYEAFTLAILQKKESHVCMQDPDCKCILLPTPCNAIHIILSEKELMHLHGMTQTVDIDIKTEAMINLFSRQD
ncbi:MAG: hypothetical protein QM802_10935 [Agriterribacter sp.]